MPILIVAALACSESSHVDAVAAPRESSEKPEQSTVAEIEPVFDNGTSFDRCKVLATEDVSEVTGVPVSAIQQRPISGCLYSWDAGAEWPSGSVFLTSVRVHESLERAKRSYARDTRDVTADEVRPAKEEVQTELARKAGTGEISEAEKEIGSAMVELMPEQDYTHQRLEGVGSEASLERRTVHVRYGNVTIRFGGQINDAESLDAAIATELGRRIVQNLESAR